MDVTIPRTTALTLTAVWLSVASGIEVQSTGDAGLTPAEWLVEIAKQTKAERRSWDNRWVDVMRGTALALEPYDARPEQVAKFTGEKKRLYKSYRDVWNRHGRLVADKLLSGNSLDKGERKYRFLANGTLLHRYHRQGIKKKEKRKEALSAEEQKIADYARAVEKAGRATLAKGYRGEKLTSADIDTLRDYALFVDIRCTGNGVLPCHLGLTRSRYGGKGFRRAGEIAPDFALARMEAFLDTPLYSDLNPRDPLDILTPLAVKEFLQIMCGYTLLDGKVSATPYAIPPGREDQVVRLSDYRNKKPVLMVFMNATDPWAWHGKIAPRFEPLKQAIGDRIAFYFVCTTIHDTRMPSMDFVGPSPRRTSYVHETAMEHRTRICKMFYMGWPSCTTDYLLDDMAQHFRNTWMDQGGGAYIVLVDRRGTIAFADYHRDIPPHWGPKAVNFPYEFLTIRMNHLESRLASFFSGACLYEKEIETDYPAWRLSPQRDRASLNARTRNSIWMSARVTAVNATDRRVTVERVLPPVTQMKGFCFWKDAGETATPFDPTVKARLDTVRGWLADGRNRPTVNLTVEDTTDVFINGWPTAFTDLRAGDHVGVCYTMNQGSSHSIRPMQIRGYRFPPTE